MVGSQARLDDGNVKAVQDRSDLGRENVQSALYSVVKTGICFPHTHRDIKSHRNEVGRTGFDLSDREACDLALREISRDRSPDCGDVDLAVRHRVDDVGGRMVLSIIAVDREAAHILDDAAPCERLSGRRVHAVVADELDADLPDAKTWIIERFPGSLRRDVGDVRLLRRSAPNMVARGGRRLRGVGRGARRALARA
jgi:hypothetical protein